MVWPIGSKSVSSSKTLLDVAAYLKVIYLNGAYNGIMQIMGQLGIAMAFYCYSFCSEAHGTHITQSECSSTAKTRAYFLPLKNEWHKNVPFEDLLNVPGIVN